ncbi:hypothetical protein Trydic_g3842, partial [Trypoxylus dichotomus]
LPEASSVRLPGSLGAFVNYVARPSRFQRHHGGDDTHLQDEG